MTRYPLFSRQFLTSKLGASALISTGMMLAMNIILLTQPAANMQQLVHTSTAIEGSAA